MVSLRFFQKFNWFFLQNFLYELPRVPPEIPLEIASKNLLVIASDIPKIYFSRNFSMNKKNISHPPEISVEVSQEFLFECLLNLL